MLRRLGRAGLLAAGAAALGGCGFRLRQPVSLAYRRIALVGFAPRSPMAEALRAALPPATQVQDSPHGADVVLTAVQDRFYRTVVGSTATGQVRELRLRVLLKYQLATPEGKLLVPETELEQSRDMSYTETAALAKEAEETTLVREMRTDIARQLLHVLATTGQQPLP